MRELDEELPQYRFGAHKGYGTGIHIATLKTLGPSSLHRMSYKPVQKLSAKQD
jgi:ribonuclease HII